MALTNATTLADYGAGIGTQGAALTVDATNKRVGVGTDAPAGPEGSLQVGTGITFFGNTGIISATGGRFSGDFSVAGALTFEDVTNIDSLGFGTFRSGLTVQGAGSTTTTLNVTGVATVSNNISIGDSIFHIGDGGGTTFGFPAADTFTVYTGGSERLRVNSSGNIGINSTIPRSKLHVANGNSNYNPGNPTGLGAGAVASLESNSDVALQFLTSTTTDNFIYFGDTDSATTGSIQYDHNTNALSFNVNGGTERLRIDSSGRLLVGHTANTTPYVASKVQVSATDSTGSVSIARYQNSASNPYLALVKSRGGLGAATIVQDGDGLGYIAFVGADGNDLTSEGAAISAEVDGTPGQDDMPGALIFKTTSDGANSATERLRITSAGYVGINQSTPQTTFHSTGTTNGQQATFGIDDSGLKISTFQKTDNDAGVILDAQKSSNGTLTFATVGTERLRIDSSGRLLVGATSGSYDVEVKKNGSVALLVGSTNAAGATLLLDGDSNGDGSGSDYASIGHESTGNLEYKNRNNGNHVFRTGSSDTERMRISNSGTVEVLTNQFTVGTHGTTGLQFINDGTFGTLQSADLKFRTGSSEKARIDTSGRLLVGTTVGTSSPNAIQTGGGGTMISSSGSVSNNGTLDITVGTSNICFWSGFLFVNNIDAANGANRTQSTYSVFADNQNASSQFTQIANRNGSSSRSFTVTYVDNGIIRFTNTSGSTCNVSIGFFGGGINMS